MQLLYYSLEIEQKMALGALEMAFYRLHFWTNHPYSSGSWVSDLSSRCCHLKLNWQQLVNWQHSSTCRSFRNPPLPFNTFNIAGGWGEPCYTSENYGVSNKSDLCFTLVGDSVISCRFHSTRFSSNTKV